MRLVHTATWTTRTEHHGDVLRDGPQTTLAQLDWVRWRLAVDLTRRYYVSSGASVRAFVFGPMDGDVYFLPFSSADCSVAPTYFGRLSRGAVRVHAVDVDLSPGCSMAPMAHDRDYDTPVAGWDDYVDQCAQALRLQDPHNSHAACWHRQPQAHYPHMYETAVWLRTRGRSDGLTGSASIAPVRSDTGRLNDTLTNAGYVRDRAEPTSWLEIGTTDGTCALGPRGHAVIDNRLYRIDVSTAATEIAGQLVERLRGSTTTPSVRPEVLTPSLDTISETPDEQRERFRVRAAVLVSDLQLANAHPFDSMGWALPGNMVFTEGPQTLLVSVTGNRKAVDSGLAYGLAHCGGRDLALVLPSAHAHSTAMRCAFLKHHVTVFEYDGMATRKVQIPSRSDVLAELREHHLRGGEHQLSTQQSGWMSELDAWADGHPDLAAAHRLSYRSWHCAGRALLKLKSVRGGVELLAGVNSKAAATASRGSGTSRKPITGPLDRAAFARVRAVIENGIADRLDGTDSRHKEHRLQAGLIRHAEQLAWPNRPEREFPARRPGGGTGYIDFLRLDAAEVLHIVETKIGHDEFLVLQGLDYWMWATANRHLLARHFGVAELKGIVVDYVLGEFDGSSSRPHEPIMSPYGPGQLESLADDLSWEVFRLTHWATDHPDLQGLGSGVVPQKPEVSHRPC